MKDILLRRTKWDTHSERNITENCISIKLSNSFAQISAELTVEILYNRYTIGQGIEIGDEIQLMYKNELIFNGKVVDTDDKISDSVMKFTAYDYSWWVCKSNITKNFTSKSIDESIREILYDIGAFYDVTDGLGDGGKIVLKNHFVKDKPAHKVLYTICSEATKNTGVYYYMHMTPEGLVTITEADKYYSKLAIKYPTTTIRSSVDGNLIDCEITESMQNMITQIAVFDEKGEKVKMYADDDKGDTVNTVNGNIDTNRFGIIQDTMEMTADDTAVSMLTKAQNKLTEKAIPETAMTVTCWGDINYRVAYGVLVQIPDRDKYANIFMYIIDSEWTWNKDGSFISKLGLSPSKKHELYEWEDIEEKQASTTNGTNGKGGTSSDLCNRIIAELKKWVGHPYWFGGKDPYNYPGMDCSGFVSYVYNQFASELDITSSDGQLTSYTFAMMNEGKDVTSDFPDNIKECDIIFPAAEQGGHVVAYLGNGQIIEEPNKNSCCRIVTMSEDSRFSSAYKVIRVVPDSAWTTTSGSDSTDSGGGGANNGYSDNLVKFTESWEGYDSKWYTGDGTYTIGYGTSTAGSLGQQLHSSGVTSCDESTAEGWLKQELDTWAGEIKNKCESKGVTLNQYSFDCMCDLCYQWGYTYLTGRKKGFFEALCNGDLETAKSEITGYPRRDNARKDMLGGTYTMNN
jgi:cell wall-associated NlpC family hydrolase